MIEFADIVDKAIHCPTEEDSIAYMELLVDLSENIKWAGDGRAPNPRKLRRTYGDETCYRVDEYKAMRFGGLGFYRENGHTIIKLDDLIETETETEETSEPILPKEERFKLLSELL